MFDSASPLRSIALHAPSDTPRTLWIELTSRCPFDCVFCSRRMRRGTGEHLDFDLYRSLLRELRQPECIRLNYSGESMHYPRLPEAIRLAKQTGARVELVTALAGASESLLREIVAAGLDTLCLSVHALRQAGWQSIYRHQTADSFRRALACLVEAKTAARSALPRLEIAFVAMRRNLSELAGVVAFARRHGIPLVTVSPVIRRDPIGEAFEEELEDGRLRDSFKDELRDAVEQARRSYSEVDLRVDSHELEDPPAPGPAPAHYWPPLPAGALIRTCDQDPWETVHVLSNGDIVPCEVQERVVLGNLRARRVSEIWHGDGYRQFRERYLAGDDRACARCPWKSACAPSPPPLALGPSDDPGPAFFRGWHGRDASGTLWSRADAVVVLRRANGTRGFLLQGVLPPAADHGAPNRLGALVNGALLGEIRNPGRGLVEFSTVLPAPRDAGDTVVFRFTTRTTWRPAAASVNGDARGLGFALYRLGPRP